MSREEEEVIIIADPPPPPPPPRKALGFFPVTADARKWWRKASTWVAALSAVLSTTAGAALLAYATLPQRAQGLVSDEYLALLAHTMMAAGAVAALVPIATSWAQSGLRK